MLLATSQPGPLGRVLQIDQIKTEPRFPLKQRVYGRQMDAGWPSQRLTNTWRCTINDGKGFSRLVLPLCHVCRGRAGLPYCTGRLPQRDCRHQIANTAADEHQTTPLNSQRCIWCERSPNPKKRGPVGKKNKTRYFTRYLLHLPLTAGTLRLEDPSFHH